MQLIDDDLLFAFRLGFRCEWCGSAGVVDPHHYWYRRGMGGGSRIDHPYNLVALCRKCHDLSHNGKEPTKHDLIAKVARRERTTPGHIQSVLRQIRNSPRK